MARISKRTVFVNDEKFTLVINCNNQGTFSATYPEKVSQALDCQTEACGKTKDEVERAWHKGVRAYKISQVTIQKVILYSVLYVAPGQPHTGLLYGVTAGVPAGVVVSAYAAVYNEHMTTTQQGKVSGRYEYIEGIIPSDPHRIAHCDYHPDSPKLQRKLKAAQVMPWTMEREEFFVKLAAYMTKLGQCFEGMYADQKAFAELTQTGELPGVLSSIGGRR